MSDNKDFERISSLWLRFLIIIFAILFGLIFVASTIFLVLFSFNVIELNHKTPLIPTILFTLIYGALVSCMIAFFVGRRIIRPVDKLSSALMQVAKGNFKMRLPKNNILKPIDDMYENFNVMVDELSNIETLRTDFVTNVSHEFKTPLSAIEGYATLLQSNTLTEEKRNEYLEKVIINAQRLAGLTGNILMLSKLENETKIEAKSHFYLDEQLRQSVLTLEPAWSQKSINFEIDLDETPFFGCEKLLYQVWTNLISNAIKFSDDNGTIEISLTVNENDVCVIVSDNGVGINESNINHIFEKFYQADKTHSGDGNGLGLTLVQKIIELCGGKITVESEIGKGTSFFISLPIETEQT